MVSPSKSHARNLNSSILWNLSGNLLPLIVAFFLIPLLIKALGTERFGLLTIAWMLVGYFSLFDFGLGKALTKATSEKIAAGLDQEIPGLASNAIFAMGFLGVVGGLILAALTPWLTTGALKISSAYQQDAYYTFLVLALAVPSVVVCTALIGLLEAHQRFSVINTIRIPLGVSNFIGPFLALQISDTLLGAVTTIFFFRIVAMFFYWRSVNGLYGVAIVPRYDLTKIVPLLKFGGWASVSNLISPVMVYFDRFVIGSVLSIAVVAYYTTPYEIVSRVSIVSISMLGVFFPAMAGALVANRSQIEGIYRHAFMLIFYSVLPVVAVIVAFAFPVLDKWIGSEFASRSSLILRVLAVGVFFNSLGRVPFGLIQAAGRADLTAKINLLEVIPYLLVLFVLLPSAGIQGAAYAWTLRLMFDFALMSYFAVRLTPELQAFAWTKAVSVIAAVVYFVILALIDELVLKVVLVLPAIAYAARYMWINFARKLKKG